MQPFVRSAEGASPGHAEVEIVERQGIGHPGSICDGIAEHVCVRLCQYDLEHFGVILHHNVDKVMLRAGASRPAFGAGEVHEPIEIYLTGRAAAEHAGVHILAAECARWRHSHPVHAPRRRYVRVRLRRDFRASRARRGAAARCRCAD